MTRGAEMRASEILQTFGYERARKRVPGGGGRRAYLWCRDADVLEIKPADPPVTDKAVNDEIPW